MVWMALASVVVLIGIILAIHWWRIGGIRERDRRKRAQGAYLTTRKVV